METFWFEFYPLPLLPSNKRNFTKLKSLELHLSSNFTASSSVAFCSSGEDMVFWLFEVVVA